MKDRKKFVPILTSILGVFIVIGFTYAWWSWEGTTNTTANVTIGDLDITYTDNNSVISGSLTPTLVMANSNINKTVTIKTTRPNVYANFSLEIITLPNELKDISFKWEMYKSGILVSNGDFSNVVEGSDVSLLINQPITTNNTPDTYILYLWIDGNMDNSPDMGNKEFSFNLKSNATNQILTSIASAPVLPDGMIPITYNGTNWIKADISNIGNLWYDYDNKRWANAVLVTSETRENYINANIGTEITESDILAYYVWVPRYKYKLWNVEFGETSPQEIDIVFESITDSISTGSVNNQYLSHPAFWWDNDSDGEREAGEELPGIWVGKFETSSDATCTAAYGSVETNCDLSTLNPRILPNITSWRGVRPSTMFNATKKIESTTYLTTNGVNQIDSHMMKNIEWGAGAYLSHSKYGKNSEITINDSSNHLTGGGAYKTNVAQSTTDNITGIYDISGGAYEYVMGVLQDNTSTNTPMSGNSTDNNSGFTGKLYAGGSWTQYTGTSFPAKKYYDLYTYGTTYKDQTAYNRSHLGDATGEMRAWYSDYDRFVYADRPWLVRGGRYDAGSYAGAFFFSFGSGNADGSCSWRSVITNIE